MNKDTFVVRDRRKPRQFSIDNLIIDQWVPIIGPQGYLIYSLLVRMARRGEEKAWPGYSLMTAHLGLSRSTVSTYTTFLSLCGLLHIENGNSRKSNTYYILDVPAIEPTTIDKLRLAVADTWPEGSRYRKTLEKRLYEWQPMTAHFADKPSQQKRPVSKQPTPGCSAGVPQSSAGVPQSSAGVPQGSAGVPEQSLVNNPHTTRVREQSKTVVVVDSATQPFLQDLLRARSRVEEKEMSDAFDRAGIVAGVSRLNIIQHNPAVTPEDILAWAAYREAENIRRPNSCAVGVIISYLRDGTPAPQQFYTSEVYMLE